MAKGILVFGANGCGKTTLGREVACILQYRHMDIEDYSFVNAEIPYSITRTREECIALMLADIKEYGSFVLSAVCGDFGEKINAMYEFAVFLSAPLEVRIKRIKERSYAQHGNRVRKGGDMFEQEQKFLDFVATRPLAQIETWAKTLSCPVLCLDATKPIHENAGEIVSQYRTFLAAVR